ncbi:Oidioi.mRNA.OKI2018_I69.chr1.g636.t1.cds [Oikopleura dioica]|uniref:Hexosyltransferase n=1 Tax=Oikopleura dioica TaxID=34765 RepID=A0ABN7SQG8_OIKDI|nr:Oidioi.mRNA.OKI2018_I69.chr1.g636.t1.cds [Oikopleura dioica]
MDENHEILEELKLHDDILYGEFKENYWNLTVKEQMFFSWTTQNAPNVKFVYRGDDDTFLNPLKILEFFEEKWDLAEDEAAMWGMKFGSGYDSTIEKQEFRDKI